MVVNVLIIKEKERKEMKKRMKKERSRKRILFLMGKEVTTKPHCLMSNQLEIDQILN